MPKITIDIDRRSSRMCPHELDQYLWKHGLNVLKPFTKWESPTKNYSISYIGESLPDKVVGVIKTCIGLVPVTEPWEGALG